MLFSLPVIPLTLFAICLLSVITFYLTYRLKIPACYGKVMLFTLAYIFINSFYSCMVEIYFPNAPWKDRVAPFILMYGPILYFATLALRDNKLSVWVIIAHSIPFLYYLVSLLCFITGLIDASPEKLRAVSQQLYLLGPISFIAYTVASFIFGRNLFTKRFRDKLLIFVFARTFLLFLAMLILFTFSTSMLNNANAVILIRMMIYSCILIFVLILFNYSVNKLLGRFPSRTNHVETNLENDLPRYEKSALSNSQLLDYQENLTAVMGNEKLFLDSSLSLTSLSLHLKMPTHHLTQVLSVQFKQTFYQYVNGFRIEHACNLLITRGASMNLEELAEKSGFNSKVSFYRQFKNIKGTTPADYKALNRPI